ncbi:MAG: protein kinase [Gemmatimonadota bacterium]|nr:protein kinase [Gemmatimonadota bacterium]
MAILLERLRLALHPQVTVLRELGGGGMAVVFLGHDVALDRPVAIKVLRPEQATAVGVERFLREARILARLRHPNIVPVFQGGEADGLLYHILEFQEGETLADRLRRGALDRTEFWRLADGLLGALDAAHAAGVIHRDVKPANIFLNPDKVVVADFGIAATITASEPLTAAGSAPGTLAYMAPEQHGGGRPTPRSDLYSAGLVLREALRVRIPGGAEPATGDVWDGVPRALVAPLKRALAESPADRWESAARMRDRLRRRHRLLPAVLAVGAVVALLVAVWPPHPPPVPSGRFVLGLERFSEVGSTPGVSWADSVRDALVERLEGFPDFVVDTAAGGVVTLQLSGRVEQRGDSLRVELTATTPDGRSQPVMGPTVAVAGWRALVDSLTLEVMLAIWVDLGDETVLPKRALPVTPVGMERWLHAEMAYRDAEWDEARRGYEVAEEVDPTCMLCAYRIRDLDRWLGQSADTANLNRLMTHLDRFPAEYRQVVVATTLPVPARIDSLRVVTHRHRNFFDAQYLLGDELLHRGPLVGVSRQEALTALQQAQRLRPDFAGVAEHLAWALIAEGHRDSARAVLDELARSHPPHDAFTAGLRAFHELAWAWRFLPYDLAQAVSREVLADPRVAGSPDLAAGARAMPALGVFGGAVGFGRLLTESGAALGRSGSLAMIFGAVAQGELSLARAVADSLRNATDDVEWRLAPLQLATVLLLVGDTLMPPPEVTRQLGQLLARRGLSAAHQVRVAWTMSLLNPPTAPPRILNPLDVLQAARLAASQGDLGLALRLTDSLTNVDYRAVDAAAGAAARILRAQWLGALDRHAEAAAELLWSEHSDFSSIPTDVVQAAEFDWAVGTAAMWQRATHLDAEGSRTGELCRVYTELLRRWQSADPSIAARRDAVRSRVTTLSCRVAP